MKYPEFQQLIDTMERANYDYKSEIAGIEKNIVKRGQGALTLTDHVKGMVYALLSNNRPWDTIAQNTDELNHIFSDFDVDELKTANPTKLVAQITAPKLHCGNRQIKKQMNCLKENIETLEKIDSEQGGIDHYFISTRCKELVRVLSQSNSPYKLKWMGAALVCEYIKGVGVEVVKPDVHLRRLLGRLGYSKKNPASEWEVIDICKEIGEEYGMCQALVDTILWQYCVTNKDKNNKTTGFGVCTAKNPKCDICGVLSCPSRQK